MSIRRAVSATSSAFALAAAPFLAFCAPGTAGAAAAVCTGAPTPVAALTSAPGQVNGLAFDSPSEAWAVGALTTAETTFIERFNGTTWSLAASPALYGSLNAVAATGPTDVWAVGSADTTYPVDSVALIEHWNGRTWSRVAAPSVADGSTLLGVTAVSPTDAWAVGQYSNTTGVHPLVERWNGKAWTTVAVSVPAPSGTGSNLQSLAAHGANDVWAVGIYQPTSTTTAPLTEHWNGTKWSFVPSPTTGTQPYLDSVSMTATNDVWAGGAANNAAGQPRTLAEHWNGTRWAIVPTPNVGPYTNRINALVAVAPNAVWATGDYYDGTAFKTLSERWNGSSWVRVPSPSVGTLTNGLGAIAALSAADIFVAGVAFTGPNGGNPLYERWNGTTWSIVPGTILDGSGHLRGVTARSASDIWAVGKEGGEHWNGSAWSVLALPQQASYNDIAEVSPTDVWAVGANFGTGSVIAHWNGTVWSNVPHPSISTYDALNSVVALSATDVWAVGSGQRSVGVPLVEHFDGKTWTMVSIPLPKSNVGAGLGAIQALAANDIWAVGSYAPADESSQPLAEHWNGSTWTMVPIPTITVTGAEPYLNALSIVSADDIWAFGVSGSSMDTGLAEHWNGHTWRAVPTPAGEFGSLYGAAANSTSDVWAVGTTYAGPGLTKASVLHWNGRTWTSVPATFPSSTNDGLYGIVAIPGTKSLLGVGNDVESAYPNLTVPLAETFHC